MDKHKRHVFHGKEYRVQVEVVTDQDANSRFSVRMLPQRRPKNAPYHHGELLYEGRSARIACGFARLGVGKSIEALMPHWLVRHVTQEDQPKAN